MMNTFKITTFNIDCAKREENYENTKFDNRFEGIIEIIKNANPSDHLCLSVSVSIDKEQHFDFLN